MRVAAADRLSRAYADHAALQRRVSAAQNQYGDRISAMAGLDEASLVGRSTAQASRLAAEIDAAVSAGERQLRQEMAAARTSVLVENLSRSMPQEVPDWPASPVGPRQPACDSRRARLAVVAESVTRILGRLETAAPEPVTEELTARASQVLEVTSATRAELLLNDLRVLVQRANERVAARRGRLDALHARLGGYAGEEIDAAHGLLYAAVDDPDPDWPGLARAVDQAIERTVAAVLNDYAVRALHESLAEVGCEVQEEFDTLLVRDGIAHVRRPGWGDLAVRVRLRPKDQSLYFNVVRPRDADAEIDPGAERDWCSAFDALLPALAEKGIDLRVNMRAENGGVQQIDPARYPFPRSNWRQWSADARREREK